MMLREPQPIYRQRYRLVRLSTVDGGHKWGVARVVPGREFETAEEALAEIARLEREG